MHARRVSPAVVVIVGLCACTDDPGGEDAGASGSTSSSSSALSSSSRLASSSSGAQSSSSASASGASSSNSSSSGGGGSSSSGWNGSLAQPALQTAQTYFPATAPWYQDVTSAAVTSDSDAITAWMESFSTPNGWGTGYLRVDFSIVAVDVPAGTAKRTYDTEADYYYVPDCDFAPVPVPYGGAVEETYGTATSFTSPFSAYDCAAYDDGGDCHMIFVSRSESRLYELYHSTIDSTDTFKGGCLAIWDLTAVNPDGRGQQCTSADAAGFPIAALLFTPEEIQAGEINHAIRFTLPNNMIRERVYVAPATHGTNTTGPATSGPYGFHLRLRADYPINTLSPAAQVVARALQKYGMFMADGGNITLTAQSDVLSQVNWADVGFDSNSLRDLRATDFDVIDHGATVPVTYDCQREQLTD